MPEARLQRTRDAYDQPDAVYMEPAEVETETYIPWWAIFLTGFLWGVFTSVMVGAL